MNPVIAIVMALFIFMAGAGFIVILQFLGVL